MTSKVAHEYTRSSKRRKLLSTNIVEARDLPDVGDELIAVKLGVAEDEDSDEESEAEIENNDNAGTEGEERDKQDDENKETDSDENTTKGTKECLEGEDQARNKHDDTAIAGNQEIDDTNEASGTSTPDEGEIQTRVFYIHKSVMCKTSGFLKAATKPEWNKPEHQPIDLTDEHAEIFQKYVQWLYTNKVAVEFVDVGHNDPASNMEDVAWDDLVDCYLLGEKLIDITYQNEIMRTCIHFLTLGSIPGYMAIRRAYRGTTATSPLRKLLVDVWVWNARDDWVHGDLGKAICNDFANDLLRALVTQRVPPHPYNHMRPWIKEPKTYSIRKSMEASKGTTKPTGSINTSSGGSQHT